MGGAHEVAEKIEHVAHEQHGGGHGSDNTGKFIGLTMAILGVLLALCSAMVGAERTELTKTMVEQANIYNEYQAASTKYRVLLGSVQQLYAQTPSRHLTDELAAKLDQMPIPAEQKPMADLQKAILRDMMMLLQPRKGEVEGFLANVARYDEERHAARAWAESWEDEIHTHFEGSEKYEKGQLLAEIGIVVASIALLLHNRIAWFVSIAAAIGCVGIVGTTWMNASHHLHEAELKQHAAEHHYQELRGMKDAQGKRAADVRDAELMAKVRERFGITAPAPGGGHGADPHAPAGSAAPAPAGHH